MKNVNLLMLNHKKISLNFLIIFAQWTLQNQFIFIKF